MILSSSTDEWPILHTWFLSTVFLRRVPHSFAFCAKGWAARISIFNPKNWTYRSDVPTLAKTQGWGTLSCGDSGRTSGPPAALCGPSPPTHRHYLRN